MQCRTCGEHGKEGLSLLESENAPLLQSLQASGSYPDFVCHDCVVEIQHWTNFVTRFQTSQTRFQQVLATSNQHSNSTQHTDVEPSLETKLPKCQVMVTKLLQCDSCSFYTNNKTQLESHMQTHLEATNKPDASRIQTVCYEMNQKCDQCGVKYASPETLSWHINNCHGAIATVKVMKINKNQQKYICVLCKSEHKNAEWMIKHLRNVHEISNLTFACNVCDVKFITKTSLQQHQLKEHNVSPVRRKYRNFRCDQCNAFYAQRELLNWHIEFCHGTDAIVKITKVNNKRYDYQCNFCKTVCPTLQKIIFHLSGKHRFKKLPLHCTSCDKRFVITHTLRKHQLKCNGKVNKQRKMVSEENGVKCKMCNDVFRSESNLKRHIKTIHAKIPCVKCRYCEQSFPSNKQLFKHCYKNHRGKTILECEICNLEFASYNGYFEHKKFKHGDLAFSCKICSKSFTYPEALKKHVDRIHAVVKETFLCYTCKASFMCKQYLSKHIQALHTGKILHCQHCKFKTRSKGHLINHFRFKHFLYRL